MTGTAKGGPCCNAGCSFLCFLTWYCVVACVVVALHLCGLRPDCSCFGMYVSLFDTQFLATVCRRLRLGMG
jgi:hypothetical protein